MLSDSLIGGNNRSRWRLDEHVSPLPRVLLRRRCGTALMSWLYPRSLPSQDLSPLQYFLGVHFDVFESPGADDPGVLQSRLLPMESFARGRSPR